MLFPDGRQNNVHIEVSHGDFAIKKIFVLAQF